MLSLITLELVNAISSCDRENRFKKNKCVKAEHQLSKTQEERIENFCVLLPPLVIFLAIILMSILYKIFM